MVRFPVTFAGSKCAALTRTPTGPDTVTVLSRTSGTITPETNAEYADHTEPSLTETP